MKASEVEIGSRVVNTYGEYGTIIGNKHRDGDEIVIVEWDDADGGFEKINVHDLKIMPHRSDVEIEKAFAEIKKCFQDARSNINDAANNLSAANVLAKEFGITLADHVDKLSVISVLSELEHGGWSHSSLMC